MLAVDGDFAIQSTAIFTHNNGRVKFITGNKFEIHLGLKKDIKNSFGYKYQMERFKLNMFTLTLIPAFLCALVNVFMTGGIVTVVILGGIVVVGGFLMLTMKKHNTKN